MTKKEFFWITIYLLALGVAAYFDNKHDKEYEEFQSRITPEIREQFKRCINDTNSYKDFQECESKIKF